MATSTRDHQARLETVARRVREYTERYERSRDSRCVFSHAYARLTRELARAVEQGRFADPEWIVALAEAFAERYFVALDGYDAGESPAAVWREVFDSLRTLRTSPLEDLVASMVAHIVHDLPLTLSEIGLEDAEGVSRIRDFHVTNDVLAGAIGGIQAGISRRYSPYLGWLDRLGGAHDEALTGYGIRVARGMAWYNASRVLDPRSEEAARAAIERSPAVFVRTLLRPPMLSLRLWSRLARLVARLGRRWPAADQPKPPAPARPAG